MRTTFLDTPAAQASSDAQTAYVFQTSEPEHDRLLRLSRVMDPFVRDTCRRLEIARGSSVIEFGCGPLGALLPLSEAVGPEGVVVGLDRSAEALDRAGSILKAQGVRNVRLVQADLNTMRPSDVCPPGPFDLGYCHFVLCYQRDLAAALRQIASTVRPGGYIVVKDAVFTAPIPVDVPGPFVPAANLLMNDWFPELLRRLGAVGDVAGRFSAVCKAAGVEEVDQRVFVPTLRPEQASTGISIYHDILAGIRPLLLQHGVASERETAGVLAALRAAQEDVYTTTIYSHLQAELVARVPQA